MTKAETYSKKIIYPSSSSMKWPVTNHIRDLVRKLTVYIQILNIADLSILSLYFLSNRKAGTAYTKKSARFYAKNTVGSPDWSSLGLS